jgi:hypothetical protein
MSTRGSATQWTRTATGMNDSLKGAHLSGQQGSICLSSRLGHRKMASVQNARMVQADMEQKIRGYCDGASRRFAGSSDIARNRSRKVRSFS